MMNHNTNWLYIPNHPYMILIIGSSGSGKTDVLLNLIKHQRPDIDKIYLCIKIHLNQNINYLSTKEKKLELMNKKSKSIFTNKLMIFMKIYKTIIRRRKEKYL